LTSEAASPDKKTLPTKSQYVLQRSSQLTPHPSKLSPERERENTVAEPIFNPNDQSTHAVGRPVVHSNEEPFDYEKFYQHELEKKHQDKSYRSFNNINRLAAKFPIAHTADPKHEVTVWCSNDYLGMSKHPMVLESMQ
jgi:5-aminolevulinate synthase